MLKFIKPNDSHTYKPIGATLHCDFPDCTAEMGYGPDLYMYARTVALPEGWYTATMFSDMATARASKPQRKFEVDFCPDCVKKFKNYGNQ